MNRKTAYKKYWRALVEIYGQLCYYCKKEIATTIDHVIPYSYDMDNSIENLVPACSLCNSLASDKHFDNVHQKREYVVSRRKSKKLRHAICPSCLLPFEYRYHSPSFILCAECYDKEYDTDFSQDGKWKRWLDTLFDAGISPDAHRTIRNNGNIYRDMHERYLVITEEYAKELESNPSFCPWVSFSDASIISDVMSSEE